MNGFKYTYSHHGLLWRVWRHDDHDGRLPETITRDSDWNNERLAIAHCRFLNMSHEDIEKECRGGGSILLSDGTYDTVCLMCDKNFDEHYHFSIDSYDFKP